MSISPLRKIASQPIPNPPIDEGDDEPPLTFRFKEITPEDWRANEPPLADLYHRGIISGEYVRQRLQIPEEAGTGSMSPTLQQPAKPSPNIKAEAPERWRLKHTRLGILAERLR